MATNQITINFEPCEPTPIGGYLVFYRPIGNTDPHRFAGPFFSDPIVFTDEFDPAFTQYEGFVQSHCGGGRFGGEIPFETEGPSAPGSESGSESQSQSGSESGSEQPCCDPEVLSAVTRIIGGEFLRLVYNVDMSAQTVSDWEVFFGTTFSSVQYSAGGTIVDLYNPAPFSIPAIRYEDDLTIVRILDFADSVTSILGHCFVNCVNLLEVSVPACTSTQNAIFFNCEGLTDVYMPLITVVRAQMFANTDNLTNLTLGAITLVESDGFFACGIPNLNLPSLTTVQGGGFRFMQNIGSLSLPAVTSVGDYAFEDMDNIAIISLPVCVTVGEGAFRNCPISLTQLNLSACSDLGGTTGNDVVFTGISGNTITLTILAATVSDADVNELDANTNLTIIPV